MWLCILVIFAYATAAPTNNVASSQRSELFQDYEQASQFLKLDRRVRRAMDMTNEEVTENSKREWMVGVLSRSGTVDSMLHGL